MPLRVPVCPSCPSALSGDGWTTRFDDSVVAGCIPVIIQDNGAPIGYCRTRRSHALERNDPAHATPALTHLRAYSSGILTHHHHHRQ